MIVVFGTLNVDLVVAVPHLPLAGEGVKGGDHQLFAGGKGGNQALAAARAGAKVALVGAVGRDGFAEVALDGLAAAGVDLGGVTRSDRPTGLQTIAVDPAGENLMIGSTGANGDASAAALADRLRPGVTLLVQSSIGPGAASAAITAGRLAGVRVVFNAASPVGIAEAIFGATDVVILNEPEAAAAAKALRLPAEASAFARAASARFVATVVVTLGAHGLVAATADGKVFEGRPPTVAVRDTTGAGDALIGALTAALDRGEGLERALRDGLAAGALACRESGARSSFADRAAIRLAADTVDLREAAEDET